jgi:hypothetical protein
MNASLSGGFERNLYQSARGYYIKPNFKYLFQWILLLININALQLIVI